MAMLLHLRKKSLRIGRDVILEHSRACHDNIGSLLQCLHYVVQMNTAVYFQIGSKSSVRDHFTDHRYLIQAFWDQLLSAETGLHGHDQYHIHQFQIRLHGLCRGGGFDGDADLFAGG